VSPPLDDAGNSVRAQKAIRDITAALNGNPYSVKGQRAVATSGR
jgi:glutaminase